MDDAPSMLIPADRHKVGLPCSIASGLEIQLKKSHSSVEPPKSFLFPQPGISAGTLADRLLNITMYIFLFVRVDTDADNRPQTEADAAPMCLRQPHHPFGTSDEPRTIYY